MTKRELVLGVCERLGLKQNDVTDIVQATLDSIVSSLADGHRLEIRNFGVFEVKERDSRVGRNPRTGEEVPIVQKRIASFKPGKALKEMVQSGEPLEHPLSKKKAIASEPFHAEQRLEEPQQQSLF